MCTYSVKKKLMVSNITYNCRYAHFCSRSCFKLAPPPKRNKKEADNLFWTKGNKFYSVKEIIQGYVVAHPVKTSTISTQYMPVVLPWSLVGVVKFEGVDDTKLVSVPRAEVQGKALNCANVLTTWRNEWLMSKEDL